MIWIFFFAAGLISCASGIRRPASVVSPILMPSEALSLEQALLQGPQVTLPYLKLQLAVASFADPGAGKARYTLPSALLANRTSVDPNRARSLLRPYLRKFHNWTFQKKILRAQELAVHFQCSSNAVESQAMGLTLERNFPAQDALAFSEILHEKVIACDTPTKDESIWRLAVFSIQNGKCDKALNYLSKFSTMPDLALSDRLTYVQGFCQTSAAPLSRRNPWGGYGIRLGELKIPQTTKPIWFLTVTSGSQDWDRLLKTMIELAERQELEKLRGLANQLDFEKFRSLPYPFQASVLTVLHFGEADLPVFHNLHRFLADNPSLISKEVTGLLFPLRFWKEIRDNSSGDPVLVKALIRQESAFNPSARSQAKAYGLMQLIYPTAKRFGVKKRQELLDPATNIRAGSQFLENLIRKFGSVEMALAAYNAGPQVVEDWQKRYPTKDVDLFVEMIPYSETREYVRLVTRNYRIYQSLLNRPLLNQPLFNSSAINAHELGKLSQTPDFASLGE